MSSTQLELVVLDNGDIALQRSGLDEPMVKISFSEEVKSFLGSAHIEVARAMIDAGLQSVTELQERRMEDNVEFNEEPKVLH